MESLTENIDNKIIEVDLGHYFRIFKAKWWFLLLTGLIFFGIGLAYTLTTEPIYRAAATILVDSSVASSSSDLADIRADEVRSLTLAQVITQRSVLAETIQTLSLKDSVGKLRSQVTVQPIPGTQLIRIIVQRPTPESSAIIANTLADTFIKQYSELQSAKYTQLQDELLNQLQALDVTIQEITNQIIALQNSQDPNDIAERLNLTAVQAQYRQSYATLLQTYEQSRLSEFASTSSIVVSEGAIVPGAPTWPKPQLILVLSLLSGVAVAAFLLLIQDYFDDTLKNAEIIKSRFGLNVIGQIGHFGAPEHPLVTINHPRSPVAEAFRNVRMNLKYLTVDQKLQTLLVTSPNESEGKSTVAANLAVVLARGGQNTILIDGDMRLPKVNRLFEIGNSRGFSELFINSDLPYTTVTHPTEVPGLSIITSGSQPPNPSELLDTKRAREIVAELTKQADVIIIDSPPLLAVTDAVALSQYVDGVIMTVRVTKTKGGMLRTALERLKRVNANLLGVLMVDIDNKAANYDDYYFSYGEYSAYLDKASDSKAKAKKDEGSQKVSVPASSSPTVITNGNGTNGHYSTEENVVTE